MLLQVGNRENENENVNECYPPKNQPNQVNRKMHRTDWKTDKLSLSKKILKSRLQTGKPAKASLLN
jgi:hypothetical protein